jgi:hypothetical protein
MQIPALDRIPFARRVVLLVLLVTGLVTTALAGRAVASPCDASEQWKYSEPELINHVGTRWVNCSVPWVVQEGTMTPYSVTQWSESCGNEGC